MKTADTGPDEKYPSAIPDLFEFGSGSGLGSMPMRVICPQCKNNVTTSTIIRQPGFWKCLFDGFKCCKDLSDSGNEIIHKCTRCMYEIGRVRVLF